MTVTDQPRTALSAQDPAVRDANRRARKEGWTRRGPLLPALVFTIVITQLPFLATLVFSFRRWNTNHPNRYGWAGFDNYVKVFKDKQMLKDIWHTVELTVTVVLVSLVLGLCIALLLNRKFMGRGAVRTMMIAPFLIVPVAAALFFKFGMFDPNIGLLNGVLTTVHHWFSPNAAPTAIDITGPHPMLAVQIALIWQWTPFMTLILLAGLQSRPGDVLEAASVDGATPWQTFTNITLPHMRQYLELAGLLGAIYIIQNFDAVFTITPLNVNTENLPNKIYQTIFSSNDNGLASAQGVIIVIGTIIIATFALRTVSSLFKEENAR
ncbi:carbohydrate ABC transporter membrane protein 1, CUT1 family [Nakamurella panacisegetis]|uniref:Carbohydrate ABC transporter membrane protein 1, CUT1 family n=1 Tax=Nakamurella panacisegetis TaxID=1090615 RepID=A0A1H0NYR7_9ACTN|nr:sugar ABC transporter permease [Nakamurella panacisegetis]SDO97676.1 carbohydrate ABC transporter membrane protein 1, CUT1 family [Nakamurella panacisegetis]